MQTKRFMNLTAVIIAVSALVLLAMFLSLAPSSAHAQTTLPNRILQPEAPPQGLEGFNNCFTYGFPPDIFFEEYSTCWERLGPDGFVRQQFKLHRENLLECDGGPGDLESIHILCH